MRLILDYFKKIIFDRLVVWKIKNRFFLSDGYRYIENANGWYHIGKEKHYHFLNGYLHSINDEPAVVAEGISKDWYNEGRLHRDNDLPAIELYNGGKIWYKNGGSMVKDTEKMGLL